MMDQEQLNSAYSLMIKMTDALIDKLLDSAAEHESEGNFEAAQKIKIAANELCAVSSDSKSRYPKLFGSSR